MKHFLIGLGLVLSIACQAQYSNKYLQIASTIAELKQKPTGDSTAALVIGLNSIGDGMGSIYYWASGNTDAEDVTFYNTVLSSRSATGRWKRVNVRTVKLDHGWLTMSGGVKTFYANGVTNSASEWSVNLTYEGTATGTAFCSTILENSVSAYPTIQNTNDAVNGCVKMEAAKTVTYLFTQGNNIVLAALGTLGAKAFIAAPTGTKVRATITCL